MDQLLRHLLAGGIYLTQLKHRLGRTGERWQPGKPLKLLLVGYNGARNTGSDVRVTEIIHQLRQIMGGPGQLDLSIITFNRQFSADYFPGVKQLDPPLWLSPKFLFEQCSQQHGVIICEGSLFKSKFTDSIPAIMSGALGMAAAEAKLSLGYGIEAGAMTAPLRRFVEKHCRGSLILCRSSSSCALLNRLGLRTAPGTDTAWTFEAGPPERGASLLRRAGWDGRRQVLVVCPINPFWWPVSSSFEKWARRYLLGQYRQQHYYLTYFYHHSEEATCRYKRYIGSLAKAVDAFSREQNLFTVIVGMDRVDRWACEALAARLSAKVPYFSSEHYNIYDLVSILQNSSFIVSSRFHAIVSAMPALVPAVGVTMDERIRNLMIEAGQADLLLEVADPVLEEKLLDRLRCLARERETIRAGLAQTVFHHLQRMGQMGLAFTDEVSRVYPEFPRPALPRSWEAHLPPLPAVVRQLLEKV